MSALYNLEPQPTAKVLLTTTSGDITIELFAQQTPLTSRNFLQHCLDGYYTNTIFHRLVSGFIVQGGDPTGTGYGGESIYGSDEKTNGRGGLEDEFHSRLKFNRRGLLGMANDNGSQFFLTLGETRELQGVNTMFGRVVGDSIYNLVRIGDGEVGASERPIYPTKITGAEVLVNPFEDMVAKVLEARATVREENSIPKKGKGKKKVPKVLLSFEDGEGEGDAPLVTRVKFNTKLVGGGGTDGSNKSLNGVREPTTISTNNSNTNAGPSATQRISQRKKPQSPSPLHITTPNKETQLPLPNDEMLSRSPSVSMEPEQVERVSSLLDRTNAQIAELKASMKRNAPVAPIVIERRKTALEQMIPENSIRGRKRKAGGTEADAQAFRMFKAFRTKLEKAPPEIKPSASPSHEFKEKEAQNDNGKLGTEEDDEEAHLCDLHFIANCQSCQSWDKHVSGHAEAGEDDDKGWMSHALSFEKDRLGKDLTWKKKNEEELVVIDPREKAKEILGEQRVKKLANKVSKVWDRDRDSGRMPERRAGERI